MKHNKIAKWIMIITGAITIALVEIRQITAYRSEPIFEEVQND